MNISDIISVPIIVTAVYTLVTLIKQASGNSEKLLRFVPLISVGLGAVLGLVAYYAGTGLIPANNVFVALMIGGSSGLAATGTHQVIKQIATKNTKDDNTKDDSAKDNTKESTETEPENTETKTGD